MRKLPETFRLAALMLLAAVCLAAVGCTTGEKEKNPDRLVDIPVTTFPRPDAEQSIFQEYRIASGDVLDVLYQARTWRPREQFHLSVGNLIAVRFVHHPELDTEQRVRPDGTISLPYLHSVQVAGRTVQELSGHLTESYKGSLKEPEVFVVVKEFGNALKELKQDLHTAPRGLSRLTTVRPDGYATFPMLGAVEVRGRTMTEVNEELNVAYDEIMPGMQVDLFLHAHSGRSIYVLGAVASPGAYKISRPTTVVEAIALASGTRDSANARQVVVMRRMEDKMRGRLVDVERSLRLDSESEFFFLQPDDIVFVPRRKLNTWATVARDVADVIFFRGWSVSFDAN